MIAKKYRMIQHQRALHHNQFWQARDILAQQNLYEILSGTKESYDDGEWQTINRLTPFVEMKVNACEYWTNATLLNLIHERDQAKDLFLKSENVDIMNSKF